MSEERPTDLVESAVALRSPTNLYHLRRIERALEDAQSCLRGEAPEVGIHEEATIDTLDQVRDALLKHLPEIKKALA